MDSYSIKKQNIFGTKINLLVNRPSHGKLKVTNSFWQTQLGDCEKAQKQEANTFANS